MSYIGTFIGEVSTVLCVSVSWLLGHYMHSYHKLVSSWLFPVPVNCTNGNLRLRGGANAMEGRVEICINGVWGTICGGRWDNSDAQVACTQLGFLSLGEMLDLKSSWNAINIYYAYRGTITSICLLWTWNWSCTSWPTWLHWKRASLAQLFSQWNRSHLILLWP